MNPASISRQTDSRSDQYPYSLPKKGKAKERTEIVRIELAKRAYGEPLEADLEPLPEIGRQIE